MLNHLRRLLQLVGEGCTTTLDAGHDYCVLAVVEVSSRFQIKSDKTWWWCSVFKEMAVTRFTVRNEVHIGFARGKLREVAASFLARKVQVLAHNKNVKLSAN